jgi:hypothetical protein
LLRCGSAKYTAYVSIRQHTSAYVSIRQHTLTYAIAPTRNRLCCGSAKYTIRSIEV